MKLKGKNVLVTGGASFIGSHLVDALIEKDAGRIRVVDNLSSGKRDNLENYLSIGAIDFLNGNLLDPAVTKEAMNGIDVVFHLAAYHGGRGVVNTQQRECFRNYRMNANFIDDALDAGVEKLVFASSGCAYPDYLQSDTKKELYLREEDVGGGMHARGNGYDPDNTYGADKLSTEIMLYSLAKTGLMKTASCRFFTVYGERGKEDHAIIAMIARAFVQQNPFEVWGTGEQIRNWTYVRDIVRGTICAAEAIDDGTAVNLGTMERTKVVDAVRMIIDYVRTKYYHDYNPRIVLQPEKPTGPLNRVADNTLSKKLLGDWQHVSFKEGLYRTIDWYFSTRNVDEVKALFDANQLTER